MTHVQGNQSLGYALSDAELLINERDAETVLVGGVDEKTDELVELLSGLAKTVGYEIRLIGEGGAFFMASKQKLATSVAKVLDIQMSGSTSTDADLILTNIASEISTSFDYTRFSGEHLTSLGFGLHLGLNALETGHVDCDFIKVSDVNRVLVQHSLFGQEMSILLETA